MNTIKKKFIKVAISLISIICLSHLISLKEKQPPLNVEAMATQKVASYIFSGTPKKPVVTTSGEVPLNASAELVVANGSPDNVFVLSYGGEYQALTLHNYQNVRISKIVMEMRSGKAGGKGNFTYSLDEGPSMTIIGSKEFTDPLWYGQFIGEYVNVTSLPNADVSHIDVNETITFKVTGVGTLNLLYIRAYHITWEDIGTTKNHYVSLNEEEDLAFGATYALGSATSLKILGNNNETSAFELIDGIEFDNGVNNDEAISKFILDIGNDVNSFALRCLSINPLINGKHLSVSDANDEYNLNLEASKNNNTAWELIKKDNTFLLKHSLSNKYLIYQSQNELFSLSSSPTSEAVTLFLLPISKVPNVEAQMFVDEVNNGVGASEIIDCHTKVEFITSVYDRLTLAGKNVYESLDDLFFHNAHERINYLETWTSLNTNSNPSSSLGENQTTTLAAFLIVAIGIVTLGGHFFLNKREKN